MSAVCLVYDDALERTGTFFCDITTAQFFPRTPTDVMFAAVMALKAYSAELLVGVLVVSHSIEGTCRLGRGDLGRKRW